MSREMRIIWLHNRLSTNDKASMKEYTQKFGISSRQALRDFRYLRINLGAPLKYSRKRGNTSTLSLTAFLLSSKTA